MSDDDFQENLELLMTICTISMVVSGVTLGLLVALFVSII